MKTAQVKYLGNLRSQATHIKSGDKFITDAPTDNNGKGEAFSPTDLLCTSLASCMITIMAIRAEKGNIEFKDVDAEVYKTMGENPRRVVKIAIGFTFPGNNFTAGEKEILKKAAMTCPVAESLHPEIEMDVNFNF